MVTIRASIKINKQKKARPGKARTGSYFRAFGYN